MEASAQGVADRTWRWVSIAVASRLYPPGLEVSPEKNQRAGQGTWIWSSCPARMAIDQAAQGGAAKVSFEQKS